MNLMVSSDFLLFTKSIQQIIINFRELFSLLHNRCQEGIEVIARSKGYLKHGYFPIAH